MLRVTAKFRISILVVVILLVIITIKLFSASKEIHITGKTMGTLYDIRVITGLFNSKARLRSLISCRLVEINSSLSTYDPVSEISRFNSITRLEDKFHPSNDFLRLLSISRELNQITSGVWDPSIDPIVNAWGFGRDGYKNRHIGAEEIKILLRKVGFKKAVIFCNDGSIQKGFSGVSIDLASIAKGFGVDQISSLLYEEGFKDFLVEIGGEVYAKGFRLDGKEWCVGIERPDKTFPGKIYKILPLSDKAIATSGDYRNFIKINDEIYSHIIDPRTGYPITNFVTSVSVVAENCTIADGLATALMILDPHEAVELVETLPFVECIVTISLKNGSLRSYSSSGIDVLK